VIGALVMTDEDTEARPREDTGRCPRKYGERPETELLAASNLTLPISDL
jgi:hypothetical protein